MELNRKYIIRVLVGDKLLTYTGKIISEGDILVEFIDKFGTCISVNKNNIQSMEEVF